MNGDLKSLACKSFTAPLIEQGSWGSRSLGTMCSTMELYQYEGNLNAAFIEWDIPAIEDTEQIGLTFELHLDGKRHLVDFDGVMDIPAQAITLLEEQGYIVDDEFKE